MEEISSKQIDSTDSQETLRKIAEALLRLMGFSGSFVQMRQRSPEDSLIVAISMDEAGMFIGEHGENLRAFEYITKLVVRKMLPDSPPFIIDVNNYREEIIEGLKEYAREVASRVSREGQEIELKPMTSYERRIIHSELTMRPDVITESRGENVERRVVVKPFI